MLRFVVASLLLASLPSLANAPEPTSKPAPTAAAPTAAPAAVDGGVDVTAMTAMVQTQVIQALRERESKRSKMSRAAVGPQQRRVRIIDANLRTDVNGQQFVAFAVDSQHGFFGGDDNDEANWRRDDITGCAYVSGDVFVSAGDGHKAASSLSGKKKAVTKPAAAHVCKDKPATVASAR